MDFYKIENFYREYGKSKKFPFYRSINENISKRLKGIILSMLGIFGQNLTDCQIAIKITNRLTYYERNIDQMSSFPLNDFFEQFNLDIPTYIYINWSQFESIDIFKLRDFSDFFFDIWYPSVDDIEIFDKSFNWLISISHFGAFSYWIREELRNESGVE